MNYYPRPLQNLITWKGAADLAKKAHGAGLFQNLEQEDDLQNLITWKGAGQLAGKVGKVLFQNLEQEDDLQNLITWKGAADLAKKAHGAGLFQNLEQDDDELMNLQLGFGKIVNKQDYNKQLRKNARKMANGHLQNLDAHLI